MIGETRPVLFGRSSVLHLHSVPFWTLLVLLFIQHYEKILSDISRLAGEDDGVEA